MESTGRLSWVTYTPRMKRWAPKYFPAELVRAAGRMLRNKLLFGSDYPLISPERWIKDFEALDVKPGGLAGHPQGERHSRTGPAA